MQNIDGKWSRGCLCRRHEGLREQSCVDKIDKGYIGLIYIYVSYFEELLFLRYENMCMLFST